MNWRTLFFGFIFAVMALGGAGAIMLIGYSIVIGK